MIHRATPQDVIAYGSGRALGRSRHAWRNRSGQRGSSGVGASAPFTPATLNPTWWLDERDQVGSPVSDWGDQSSGGLGDFAQASAANRPAVSSLNSLACLSAADVNDYMDCARTLSQVLSTTAFTLYIVCAAGTVTSASGTFGYNVAATLWGQTAGGSYGVGLQQDGSGGYRVVFSGTDGTYKHAYSANGSFALGATTANLVVVTMAASGVLTARCGSAAAGSSAAFGTPTAGWDITNQRLFRTYNLAAGETGLKIAEIVGFSSVLSGADDTNMRTYLGTKWGATV